MHSRYGSFTRKFVGPWVCHKQDMFTTHGTATIHTGIPIELGDNSLFRMLPSLHCTNRELHTLRCSSLLSTKRKLEVTLAGSSTQPVRCMGPMQKCKAEAGQASACCIKFTCCAMPTEPAVVRIMPCFWAHVGMANAVQTNTRQCMNRIRHEDVEH